MSLTEFSLGFKRFILYSVIACILYITGKATIIYAYNQYKLKNPAPIPPAEAKFGSVPLPKIPQLEIASTTKPVYVLDTKTGKLPTFPTRLPIFTILEPKPTILSEKRARDVALYFSFGFEPQKLSTTEFVWEKEGNKLFSNTALGLYSMSFDFSKGLKTLAGSKAVEEKLAKDGAVNFLSANGLLKDDLSLAQVEVSTFSLNTLGLFAEKNLDNAVISKVNFIREITEGEEKFPIYTFRRKFPLVSVTISKDSLGKIIIPAFNYTYWEVDKENSSQYSLEPLETCFENVKEGKGIITALFRKNIGDFEVYRQATVKRFLIKDIKIAYIESPNYFKYLEPFYIFFGDAEYDNGDIASFDIYYPAIEKSKIAPSEEIQTTPKSTLESL